MTINSDSIFRELQPKPPYLKKVILHTAGRDLRMDGFVVGPVALKLGKIPSPKQFMWPLYRMRCCKG